MIIYITYANRYILCFRVIIFAKQKQKYIPFSIVGVYVVLNNIQIFSLVM